MKSARHPSLALAWLCALALIPAARIRPAIAATPAGTPGIGVRAGEAVDRAFATVKDEVADALLAAKVRIALLEHVKQGGLGIHIKAVNGAVTLTGTVDRRADVELAERVASSVSGVRTVRNRIESAAFGRPTQPALGRTVGKVESALANALLVTKVKARLLDQLGRVAFSVEVDATDGVVSLSGTVPDEARRNLAVQVARDTKGVGELHDLLKIQR